ncbi:MAG TPA: hypothetical protein VF042_14320, partial [Gemmatimonadaceae bacterium]
MRGDIYALAAMAGASVVVIGRMTSLPTALFAILGGVLCFALRYTAIRRGWQLPVAGRSNPDQRQS